MPIIEEIIVNKDLVPHMEDFYKNEIMYFTDDEFCNRIILNGKTVRVEYDELNEKYNSDQYSPVDGRIVRLSDHYSALLEADSSIKHGITSKHLRDGKVNLLKSYPQGTIINGIDAGSLFAPFAAS